MLDTNVLTHERFDESMNTMDLNSLKPILNKQAPNFIPIIDDQKGTGTYTSSKVIINAEYQGNDRFIDWSESYITVPYETKLSITAGASSTVTGGSTAYDQNLLTALKNNSLVESIKVEQNGRVLVEETTNMPHIVNYIHHCTMTEDKIKTQTSHNQYHPDGGIPNDITAGIDGIENNRTINNSATVSLTNSAFNEGALKRQYALYPRNSIGTTFMSQTNQDNEYDPYQEITSEISGDISTETFISKIHFLAKIKLSDIHDFFKKHPFSKGCTYKITLIINQGYTTITTASGTTPLSDTQTLVKSTLTGQSNTFPLIFTGNTSTSIGGPVITVGTGTTHTLKMYANIDTSSSARQTGVFLYMKSFDLTPEYENVLLQKPIINTFPFMILNNIYLNNGANGNINLTLFNAVSNPRALVIIPQYTQNSSYQTQPSQWSAYNTSPATTDPVSLTKIQVRLNSKNLLANPSNYTYQQFNDNTNQVFKLFGGIGDITSGVIDLQKFTNLYRYYVFDLSPCMTQDQWNVPQLISLDAFNNSAVPIDLYCFCLYQKTAIFDNSKGVCSLE